MAAVADLRPPVEPAPTSRLRTVFGAATNATRDVRAERPAPKASDTRGCFAAAWQRIRNAVARSSPPDATPARATPTPAVATPARAERALDLWARSGGLGENRLEAMRRIDGAHSRGSSVLDIARLGLSAPPPEIPDLYRFSCADNRLRQLPAFAGEARYLDVSGNPLEALDGLPPGIHSLHASGCGLTALPAKLPETLRILHLENNRLTGLPPGIELHPRLGVVHLEGNPLDSATRARVRDWNRTHASPQFRVTLEERTPFRSGQHAFRDALSDWVRSVHRPHENRAEAANRILRAAQAISDGRWVPRESFLSFAGLHLSTLPPEIPSGVDCVACQRSQLREVSTLPDSIESLDVSDNPLHAWPELPSGLRFLRAARCGFTTLPATGQLPQALVELELTGNRLVSLPPDIVEMPHLRDVFLGGNPLDAETRAWIRDWTAAGRRPRFHMVGTLPRSVDTDTNNDTVSLEDAERVGAQDPEGAFERFVKRLAQSHDTKTRA